MTNSDLEAIREARERAQNTALYGSDDTQAGLVDEFLGVKRYVGHILREAQSAEESWSHWEAINDIFENEDAGRAVIELELGGIGSLRAALARDALLQAYKLSDPFDHPVSEIHQPSNEKTAYSLCGIAKLLDDAELRTRLSSRQWALDLGHHPMVAVFSAEKNANRIIRFRDLIQARWAKVSPQVPEFVTLRASVKPLRDRVLARTLGKDAELSRPTIDQTRKFISLTLELATDMELLFTGHAVGSDNFREAARKRSAKFWSYAFKAPISEYQRSKAMTDQKSAAE